MERLLPFFFHGGQSWKDETAPDADMPRAKGNPAKGGVLRAEMVDLDRAWKASLPHLRNPLGIWLRYANDRSHKEISVEQGIAKSTVRDRLEHDVAYLRDAMTYGLRPEGRNE